MAVDIRGGMCGVPTQPMSESYRASGPDGYMPEGFDFDSIRGTLELGDGTQMTLRPDTVFTINRPELDEHGNVLDPTAEQWDGTYR